MLLSSREQGGVTFRIETVSEGWSAAHKELDTADQVIAFSVIDTGIGIPAEKHRIIFEAFQQADGTITRKYGGTGLGLSISRGIAQLLGGEIRREKRTGAGKYVYIVFAAQRAEFRAGRMTPSLGNRPTTHGLPKSKDRAWLPMTRRISRKATACSLSLLSTRRGGNGS